MEASIGNPHAHCIGINAQKLALGDSYHNAGSSRYLFSLLRELRGLDTEEEILAYVREAQLPPELEATGQFRPRPCRWPTDHPAARIAWEQLLFPRQLRHDGVSLLHGALNALPLGWRGPSVVTILDLTFLTVPQAFRPANRIYLGWMTRVAARRADRVITISESTRQDVLRYFGIDPARVRTIHCGIDSRFAPIDDQEQLSTFRARHGLPPEFILFLGTIEPRKNVLRLIEAYAELRQRGLTRWPLVIAGGKGWGHAPVFERAAQADLGHDLRFVGFVPDDELPLWYNAATLFVYPSEYEGFGLPPLEALACGTPVVASNRSSLPEVLGEAAVLVDPTRASAIADGMQQALEDRWLREHLAAAGPAQARPFTWRRMAEATLEVYRQVLERQ